MNSAPIRALALTQGGNVPGTRFRVVQYMPTLARAGIEVTHLSARFGAYPPKTTAERLRWLPRSVADAFSRAFASRSDRQDVCLLQRELVSTLVTAEPFISAPFIFDVDDAIFLHRRGRRIDRIARRASLVICGNRYLAEHYGEFCRVEILPTAVDTARFHPVPSSDRKKVIGWSGSSSGLKYLYDIEPALLQVLGMHPDAELHVVSDRPPHFTQIPPDRVRYVPWTPDIEVSALQGFSIGLMPLADDPWARGKCSFKMLTYMAVGLPVVVSPVGMNSDVLALGQCGFGPSSNSEWVDAMDLLLKDEDLASRLGASGRNLATTHFDQVKVAVTLARLIRTAATSLTPSQ